MFPIRRPANIATRLAGVFLAASVGACTGMPNVLGGLDGSATAQQLNAPWQSRPMRPSDEILAAADEACRKDAQFKAGLPLVLVDARGEGRLQLFYGAPTGESGECHGIFVGLDGSVRPGGASSSGAGGPWPPIAPDGLAIMTSGGSSGGLGGDEQHVAGRAGPAIERVQLTVAGIADPIEATMANGWWSAWWPGGPGCTGIVAMGADGSVLSSVPGC